ncbi:UDP-N-acetylmuramate dehydrogenase [bacterium]|nr:UDP-N-acetylmuramate dehydrogenase [bacterium]
MLSLEHIRSLCSGELRISEALAPMTSFRIGGPVDIYIEPAGSDELTALVQYLRESDTSYLVLGNGSNILISDDGFRGVVLNIEKHFSGLSIEGDVITAGAGARLSKFVDFCVKNGKSGSEMLAGIPGTLGGAVIMNAGAYGGEISDYMLEVSVLRDGRVQSLAPEQCGFRYRGSELRGDIVLRARFRFPEGDMEALRARRKELLLKRNAAQPVQNPNAGSIFKNPEGDYAARLIEACGLKGQRFGGAVISEKHANFIVNDDDASAMDVINAMNHVRRTVFEETGVELEPEIQLIGFPDDIIQPVNSSATS